MFGLIVGSVLLGGLSLGALCWFTVTVGLHRALMTYSRSRLESIGASEERVEQIESEWDQTERAVVIHNFMAGLLFAILVGIQFLGAQQLGSRIYTISGWVLLTVTLRIVGGVIGRVFAESLLLRAWSLALSLRSLAAPLMSVGNSLESYVRSRSGSRGLNKPRPASVEVEFPDHQVTRNDDPHDHELTEATRERLEKLIKLEKRDVGEIMTPKSSIILLPANATAPEAARALVGSGHSRIPLFGETRDDIIGVLYAKDLFADLIDGTPLSEIRIRQIAKPPLCVPETKRASDLIVEMQLLRIHLAIVLDEYGGVSGLVTLEDLLEEFLGSIDDEHDIPTPSDPLVQLDDDCFEVDGTMNLEEINERLRLEIPTDRHFQTIGGFVFDAVGHLPEPGATLARDGIEFTIIEVIDNSIRRLKMNLRPQLTVGENEGRTTD